MRDSAGGRPARWPRAAVAATLLAALLQLPGCERSTPPAVSSGYQADWLLFGSPATLLLPATADAEGDALLAALRAELAPLERDWHPWQPGALVELNAAFAAGRPAQAPASLRRLLERSRPYTRLTGGAFEPAAGGLVRLWGFHTGDYPLRSAPPDAEAIAAWRAAAPTLAQVVELPDGRLASSNPAVQLDFNAIAEGAAMALAIARLRQAGVRDALLSLGGETMALGARDGRPWRIGIRDPLAADAGGVLAGIALGDGEALFSSGGYHKYRTAANGGRWPHLLDPRTGMPVRGVSAVSVLHADPVLADVAASSLFVAGADGFAALARRLGVGCALLLTEDDVLLVTRALWPRLLLQRQPAGVVQVDAGDGCVQRQAADASGRIDGSGPAAATTPEPIP